MAPLHPPPHTPAGELQAPRVIGPVEQRLLSYGELRGWCFGAWGEASEEMHSLVQRLATARAEVAYTLPHRRGTLKTREVEKAGLVGYLRRTLSFTAVRETARLLLDRLQLLGDGAAEDARRRDRVQQLEAAAYRERRAQAVSMRQGRNIMRHGFGMLDTK